MKLSKILFYRTSFCFLFLSLAPSYSFDSQPLQKEQSISQHNPHNTIIAFDIHNVITEKRFWPMFKITFNYPYKWKMISHLSLPLIRKTCSLVWNKEWNKLRKLFEEENQYLFGFMHNIADTQYPIQGTIDIIKDLKEKGYPLHILSNISDHAYKSFEEKFPEIFSLFDEQQITIWENGNVIEKPSLDYFKHYLAKHNPENKHVIFIDDQVQNIDAAQQLGIIGITFNNPQQLQHELKALRIIE